MNWWCGVGGEDACVMNYEGCLDDRWKIEWAADLLRCVHTVQYIV